MSKSKNTKSQKTLGKIYNKNQFNNSSVSWSFIQSNNNDSNTSTNTSLNVINNSNFNYFNSTKSILLKL